MPGLKEIRRRISSVKSTMQITRAMKLVSAAKLKRAQDAALNNRAFGVRVNRIFRALITDLRVRNFTHPLLTKHESIKKRRVVVITADRGLCGGFNANITKTVNLEQFLQNKVEVDFVLVGKKAVAAAKRLGWHSVSEHESLPESIPAWPMDKIAQSLIDDYSTGKIDEVILYYTQFVSGVSQRVTSLRLLPLTVPHEEPKEGEPSKPEVYKISRQIKYSPEPEEIFNTTGHIFVQMQLQHAAAESKASEHAARMTAMDSATHNASELIDKLRLFYNRARQGAITKELLDVLGGAEAIK